MAYTRKTSKKYRKTMKKMGGSPSAKKAAASEKKLRKLRENSPSSISSGMLSTTMPFAITAAKKAIDFANAHRADRNAKIDAENKMAIADLLTGWARRRQNWRKERREGNSPNSRSARAHVGHEWYVTSVNDQYVLH
jgi:hypothetical protein